MPDIEKEVESNGRALVLRAAGLVSVFLLLARALGLVREIITQAFLGTDTVAANAYAIAVQFPDAIFFVIAGGAMSSAFIPTFAAYFAHDDAAGGWRLFSGVINLLLIAVTAVVVVTAVFAPGFVQFFFNQKIAEAPEILPQTVRLVRIMLASTIIFGVSGVVMGALQARQHFLMPAIAPILYNLGIIVGGFFIKPAEFGLSIGAVIGAVAHLIIQLPALQKRGGVYTAVFSLNDPGIRQVLRLMGPRVLGLSFSQLNQFVILFLTGRFSQLPLGSFVALRVAFRITILPQGIIGQALGIAAFPTLATLAAKAAYDEMRRILTDSMRILFFLGLPITILMMILRVPIITILFERGLFDEESTRFAAWALLFYALGLIALIALEVVNRTFYALSDTWTPVVAGAFQIVLMGVLSYWFGLFLFPGLGLLPLGGLALGFSLSNILELLILWLLLRRKMGRLDSRHLLYGAGQMCVAGLVMVVLLIGGLQLTHSSNVWIQLGMAGSVGSIGYLVASWLLNISEMKQLWTVMNRIFTRLKTQKPG